MSALASSPSVIEAPVTTTTVTFKDVVALGKPSIAAMAIIVAAGTFLMATPSFDVVTLARGFAGLLGTAFIVMGAGALNMLLERDIDARMPRTKDRPLAAGRMSSTVAFCVGAFWCALSIPLLWSFGNGLTAALGVFSLFLYVLVYTPMKQVSPWSLVVGAVPGAMPALMGGTIATGKVELTGLAMFAVVFLWQLPHFLAISLYREPEYTGAGHKVFPTQLGMLGTKIMVVTTTLLTALLGAALWPLGLGGPAYFVVSVFFGAAFCVSAFRGFSSPTRASDNKWARKVFMQSLIWQTVVFGALAVDRVAAAMFFS